jgi:hypothetical protein
VTEPVTRKEKNVTQSVMQLPESVGRPWAEVVGPYESAVAEIRAGYTKAAAEFRMAFLAGCRALFEAHPDLRSFSWTQSCDEDCRGDCCGSLSHGQPAINGTKLDLNDGWYTWDGEWKGSAEPSPEAKLGRAVWLFQRVFAAEDMIEAFGTDVRVAIRRDGTVKVRECYYDDESFEDDEHDDGD